MIVPQWLRWARELQALSQTGRHFTQDPYDRERYEQLGRIAEEMMAGQTDLSAEEISGLFASEFGYATPKVDLRGVVFRENRILLISETADGGRWTVPGGWADVNESSAEGVERELFEETGYQVKATRLLAVYDRDKHDHYPPYPYHIYKLFFQCEIVGGEARANREADDIRFWHRDELPELSVSRVTAAQIERFFELRDQPTAGTDFD